MDKIKKIALINSILAVLYVSGVGSFMYFGTLIKVGRTNAILAPITLLLLFVVSATITGFLIIGKPAQLYVDGKKKEALVLFSYTLAFLSIITLVAVILLVTLTR
jgi:hypothetical protein